MNGRARSGLWARVRPRGGRGDRSALGMWFFDIDRVLLLLALLLIAIGLLAVAAASPASAVRYSSEKVHYAPLYYFWRQLMWVAVGVPAMIIVSMLPVDTARRLALLGAAFFFACLVLVPYLGVTVNGARRWLGVGIAQFQPSEFLKPCFVVAIAWLLSLKDKDPGLPVVPISMALLALVGFLLMRQPDFGQTVVFVSIWLALVMVSGMSFRLLAFLGAAAPVGLAAAYIFYQTARVRIDAFICGIAKLPHCVSEDREPIDTFQTDAAHATITGGGWFGTGPGGGTMKFGLPEAHTDYIFSVVGEEFGLIACGVIALIFVTLVVRVFVKLLDETDSFRLLAAAGLATQFGVQALISMAVNTGLAPSKGMTLPFISYGGSSMLALSGGMGLLLAFTRRNPFLVRSPYIVRWNSQ
ncbi:putative peptidoglycan glycosyltransferase FtsW [Sphingomonas sp.]|uniref:peptidoglycan glycosyltransferase FtsW n=1 Tax=Sphingomonas sp. TaxID=28214 RepID=UPI001D4C78AB|nr:putative peptidoglycan glycosyltransferase FtsW [Sphingomonas sp.]MBX9795279.1 putative lipid II flippase FtsW [Sphingomonas sp.]